MRLFDKLSGSVDGFLGGRGPMRWTLKIGEISERRVLLTVFGILLAAGPQNSTASNLANLFDVRRMKR
jgi:hypothetical protein